MTTKQTQATVDVASLTVAANPNYGWYRDILANWSTRESGPKPTRHLFDLAHSLDTAKRAGSEQLHIAMCLRPAGSTVRQFQIAGSCGPANNYRRALVNTRRVNVTVQGKPYAYVMTVTPKGVAAVAKAVAAQAADKAADAVPADKPAKPAAPRKPRQRPAKPAVTVPAGDTAAVTGNDQHTGNIVSPDTMPSDGYAPGT